MCVFFWNPQWKKMYESFSSGSLFFAFPQQDSIWEARKNDRVVQGRTVT